MFWVHRTDEGGRHKCGQYWPPEEGGQEVYGHIAVVNQRVDRHSHYNQTTLELHNTEVGASHQKHSAAILSDCKADGNALCHLVYGRCWYT